MRARAAPSLGRKRPLEGLGPPVWRKRKTRRDGDRAGDTGRGMLRVQTKASGLWRQYAGNSAVVKRDHGTPPAGTAPPSRSFRYVTAVCLRGWSGDIGGSIGAPALRMARGRAGTSQGRLGASGGSGT